MDKHFILVDCQHAFRKNHSTDTALLEVTDQIWKGMDKQQVTTDVLVDLSKAFAKVDHKILLDKVTKCGICCDWFWSYLTARTQAVQQDDTLSEFLPTSSGVPQGSCLGLVLFSIYTNDLPQNINSKVVMCADDTQILASYQLDNQQSAFTMVQSDLMALQLWMVKNHLTINTAKTQVITVTAEESTC